MHLPGVRSRAIDVPHMVGAVSAKVIHETPTEVTIEYLVPTGGDFAGLGELDGFFKSVWKTFRKIVPYAAPIAGAVIPQIFPTSPWYVKAIPTAVAFAAPRKQMWQTVGLTAGATIASEALRRYLRPLPTAAPAGGPPAFTTGGGGAQVVAGPGKELMRLPSGQITSVAKETVPAWQKIGAVLIGAATAVMGAGAAGAPPGGGFLPGPGGPPPLLPQPFPVVVGEQPRVFAVDPATGQPVVDYAGGFFPPGATTEFLPMPGAPPEAPAGAGQIPWGTVAMIGIPLVAVAMMARS